MSTDNDKATIKNMRHNIARQPKDRNVSKTVRAVTLEWGANVGGADFDEEVRNLFSNTNKKKNCHLPSTQKNVSPIMTTVDQQEEEQGEEQHLEDPLQFLAHLIASDILYEIAALEPLSSVISEIKLRNPVIKVIFMLRERSPNAISNLKTRIEEKVRQGLEERQTIEHDSLLVESVKDEHLLSDVQILRNFSVTAQHLVRSIDKSIMQFQVVEC